MKKKHVNPSIAQEPAPQYQKQNSDNTIHFFSSFEAMNEHDIKEMAMGTAEQRFKNILTLINSLFATQLKQSFLPLEIQFK